MSSTTRRVALAGLVAGALALTRTALQAKPAPKPAPDPTAPGPTPPRDSAPRLANTHDHPLVTWALSPDGRTLATGAEADLDHMDDPVAGLVLWDLDGGQPLRSLRVPGGVGLCDQLRGAIRFSEDGKIVAFNGHTNRVFVARTDTGEQLAALYLTENDGPPQHVLSPDGEWIFVEDYGNDHLGGVVPARHAVPPEQVQWLPVQTGTLHALALHEDGLVVLNDGVFRTISRTGSAMAQAARLLNGHRVARLERRLLAAAGEGVALMTLRQKQGPLSFPTLREVEAFAFSTASERVLALTQSKGGTRAVALHTSGAQAALDRALGSIDWFATPDLLPAAPSPDGTEALLLGEDGTLERWSVEPGPAKLGSLGSFSGLRGVLWPRPDRAVVAGPQQLVFLEMPSGEVLRSVGFPARED